jgi:hypothetical protein
MTVRQFNKRIVGTNIAEIQSNAKKSRQKQFPVIVFPQNVIV